MVQRFDRLDLELLHEPHHMPRSGPCRLEAELFAQLLGCLAGMIREAVHVVPGLFAQLAANPPHVVDGGLFGLDRKSVV